jgi:hypothetical protein
MLQFSNSHGLHGGRCIFTTCGKINVLYFVYENLMQLHHRLQSTVEGVGMGEAKRRNSIIRDLSPARRADIARAVRSIEVTTGAGTCFLRAVLGHRALEYFGIRSSVVFGAMLYRAGPSPLRDVVAFCGQGNKPQQMAEIGVGAAHHWLHCGEDLIDFSVGDWQNQSNLMINNPLDVLPTGEPIGPIQWTAPPLPDFWWQPRSSLVNPWRPTGEPELGVAWYHPAEMPDWLQAKYERDAQSEPVRLLSRMLHDRCTRLVADWHANAITEFPATIMSL